MTWNMALFTYLNVWWLMLFFTLPWGNQLQQKPDAHHYAGAPVNPNIKKKMLVNTLLAAVVTLGIHLLLKSGWIPLRDVMQ